MLAQHPQRVLRVWSSVSVGWVGDHMILCAQPSLGMEIDLKSLSLMLHLPVPQGGQIPDLFCLTPHPSSLTKVLPHLGAHQIWGPSGGTDF